MFPSMVANPESPPKIDWSYYKKNVTTPGLVDQFQKQYDALSIPYPADKYTAEIESEEKQVVTATYIHYVHSSFMFYDDI